MSVGCCDFSWFLDVFRWALSGLVAFTSGQTLGSWLGFGQIADPGFGWALGGRLGFGISAGLWAASGYRVGWVWGLSEDFGLATGFWALSVIDGCLI